MPNDQWDETHPDPELPHRDIEDGYDDRPRRRHRDDYDDDDHPREPDNHPLAIASLICGLIGWSMIPAAVAGIVMGFLARSAISRNPSRYKGKGMATAGIILGFVDFLIVVGLMILWFAFFFAFFVPNMQNQMQFPPQNPRQVREQRKAENEKEMSIIHLEMISQGLQSYNDEHKHLPPAAETDIQGTPTLSWRALIADSLDGGHRDFHPSESWDSEHNKPISNMMPSVFFQSKEFVPKSTQTHFRIFVGPGTLIRPKPKNPKPAAFLDLRAVRKERQNQILLVETEEAVDWADPDGDIPFDAPLPKLKSYNGRCLIMTADGKIHAPFDPIPEDIFRGLIINDFRGLPDGWDEVH